MIDLDTRVATTMHSTIFVGCMVVLVACMSSVAAAADAAAVAAGKEKAVACAVCHGLDGLSKNPDAPNLAGDNADYIIKQLKAFKTGTRQDERMSIMAVEVRSWLVPGFVCAALYFAMSYPLSRLARRLEAKLARS